MLQRLPSEIHTIKCTDNIDETTSTHQWGKKANEQLKKLDKDCNLTAGLKHQLEVAVGARVMLRRNIDTKSGLVNGAIGTVVDITFQHISVLFDHMSEPFKVKKIRSKFMVMKNFYVFREQFPLILAYAITIHKCQGLSLDTAIVDLSDTVFAAGMAYVALSRVRTLSGLHLIAFDPKSIMVSVPCLKELNRLRQAFRKDLTLYNIPKNSTKRKLTGTTQHDGPDLKKIRCTRKCKQPCDTDPSEGAPPDLPNKPKQLCTPHHSTGPSSQQNDVILISSAQEQHTLCPFKFHSVDAAWQHNACDTLGLQFRRSNGIQRGAPTVPLTPPRITKRITGDGNCLFRSLSYIITGGQDQHMALRTAIVNHMVDIAHLLLGGHISQQFDSVQSYIAHTNMDQDSAWGTDIEMLTLAHLLHTTIYSYDTQCDRWSRYRPQDVERTLSDTDVSRTSMYIRHGRDHFDIVHSV